MNPALILLLLPLLASSACEVVPFRLVDGNIRVEGRFDGGPPTEFIFDTGLPVTGIHLFAGSTVGQDREGIRLERGTLALGNVEFPNVRLRPTVIELDIDAVGVLGLDLLERRVVEVDYPASEIRLHDSQSWTPPPDFRSLPLLFFDHSPFVEVDIALDDSTRTSALCCLDLGAATWLHLYSTDRQPIEPPGKIVSGVLGVGVEGPIHGQWGRVGELSLGGVVLEDVVTAFSDRRDVSGFEDRVFGNIGNGVLSRFDIVFDYSRDTVYFRPNRDFGRDWPALGESGPVRGTNPGADDLRRSYVDVIDHRGLPAAAEDWLPAPFADLGAWFGFTLPAEESGKAAGGFGGPFLHAKGRWLGAQLVRLEMAEADQMRVRGLPGRLEQEFESGALRVVQSLRFTGMGRAVLRTRIHNRSDLVDTLDVVCTGSVFPDECRLDVDTEGRILVTAGDESIRIVPDHGMAEASIEGDGYRWRTAEPLIVAAHDSLKLDIWIEHEREGDLPPAAPGESERAGAARWNGYLRAAGCGPDAAAPAEIVAAKSVQTLVNNWRGPTGRFRYGGLFPSSNVWYFNGFWAWDSWKHAVGLALFDPAIAASQLRLMFDHQDETGMIADVVYLDADEDNWRDTKPPLAGWALERVYERTGDQDLVADLYPRLEAYHRFWYAHRDHDGDGLCEYGSTDGTLEAARWESGMDNAVRFDSAVMVQNGPRAWSMNQESVDLNSYLYREKLALARLSGALGDTAAADSWRAEAEALGERIRTRMFDETTGWFHDIDVESGEIVPVQGPEGWIPLWAGVATAGQAERIRSAMLDPAKFRTHAPLPTVARDDPGFSDGYWRGLVWLDQIWFGVAGLRAYGYGEDADALTRQVLANLEGAVSPGAPLRENYHPLTGEGRNAPHFSWTAAHLLLLLQPE